MKVAVLADIHGNIEALRSVLGEVEKYNVDEIWIGGDLVGYFPYPNEVIEVIRSKGFPVVMGNYDDAVAFFRIECGCDYPDQKSWELGRKSLDWTKKNVKDDNKEFLKGLPREVRRRAGGKGILMVHGSPRRLNEYLTEDFPEEELKGILEEAGCDLLICGHTHIPYHRQVRGKDVINAGSVGKPKGGDPRASFVLIEVSENGVVECEIMRVEYNVERVAQAVKEAGLPEEFAEALSKGGK